MKTLQLGSSRSLRALSALGLVVALMTTSSARAETVVNPISAFSITVDGQFTDANEWSDISSLSFISSPPNSLFQTTSGDPNANAFLYAGLAPGVSVVENELYLMYDYLGRTDPNFAAGEFIADIKFPITRQGVHIPITVQVRGDGSGGATFTVVQTSSGTPVLDTDMEGAVGFGPSPESSSSHLLIELEVSLNIPDGFSSVLPGTNGDGDYSPDPAFWGASAAKDAGDPPITAALFTINPDGSTTVTNDFLPLPEPSSIALGVVGMAALSLLLVRRRR